MFLASNVCGRSHTTSPAWYCILRPIAYEWSTTHLLKTHQKRNKKYSVMFFFSFAAYLELFERVRIFFVVGYTLRCRVRVLEYDLLRAVC